MMRRPRAQLHITIDRSSQDEKNATTVLWLVYEGLQIDHNHREYTEASEGQNLFPEETMGVDLNPKNTNIFKKHPSLLTLQTELLVLLCEKGLAVFCMRGVTSVA